MNTKMIAAAIAAVAMSASADVVSSDVVGYVADTTGSDNNFVCVPFNAIGFNTADIQQIGLSDDGAGTIGWGTETFSIWEGVPTVADGSEFFYCDPSYDMTAEATTYYWGDSEGTPAAFSVAPGQGVVVNCAADLSFSTSGQVSAEPVEFTTVADNNFTGNPFPQTIDIQAITISDGDAGSIGWGTETFSVWEGVPTVAEGSEFFYCDPSYDMTSEATTYYWGDSEGNKVSYEIPAGKGVVINCAADLTVTIEPPFSL